MDRENKHPFQTSETAGPASLIALGHWERHGESVDPGGKTAAHIHECAAEARLLGQPRVSSGDGGSIPEGIPKGPHGLPQNFLKNTPAFGDFPPSHVLGRPRENRVGERMSADTHSRSGQLPQPGYVKSKKSGRNSITSPSQGTCTHAFA